MEFVQIFILFYKVFIYSHPILNPVKLFMRKIYLLIIILLTLITQLAAQTFKVVGYLPYYRFSLSDSIQYHQLTHLNLAFLNPDSSANLSIGGADITPVVTKAHMANPNIQVFISLAGGALTAEWAAAYDHWMQAANRSEFIHKLISYVETHQLDGIDVDLEWSHVNSLYSPFVIELADSLHTKGKQITAAWPATTRFADISNEALAVFDWINLMAYDLTGPWAPTNPGQHSPYSFANQGITYWMGQGVPADKMVLGVPFYGRSWDGTQTGQAFTYGAIVAEDTSYAFFDQVGQRYYNGIPTIQQKTLLAQMETAGIMIWELGQDAFGNGKPFSLLQAIDDRINQATSINPLSEQPIATWYPNPFSEILSVNFTSQPKAGRVIIRDMNGRTLIHETINPKQSTFRWQLAHLPSGMYVAEVHAQQYVHMQKIIKHH